MAYQGGGRSENINRLQNEVSEVTSLLKDNVEKVIERGERIDNLQARSEDLECSSSHFKRGAGQMRRKMWWKNCKLTCLIIFVVLIIIGVIVTVILLETKPWDSGGSGNHHNGSDVNAAHEPKQAIGDYH